MFKRKLSTVDSIMSTFRETIDQLREVAEVKDEEATEELNAASMAKMRAEEARLEARRAREVTANLNKLMGNDDVA